jgi:hypothetical protein
MDKLIVSVATNVKQRPNGMTLMMLLSGSCLVNVSMLMISSPEDSFLEITLLHITAYSSSSSSSSPSSFKV